MACQENPHTNSNGEPCIYAWGVDSENHWVKSVCYGAQAIAFCKFVHDLKGGEGGSVKFSAVKHYTNLSGPSLGGAYARSIESFMKTMATQ